MHYETDVAENIEYIPSYQVLPLSFRRAISPASREYAAATRILRARAAHLSSLSREQGQQEVREYRRKLIRIADLLDSGCRAFFLLGNPIYISFPDIDENVGYTIFAQVPRNHHAQR